MHVCKHFTVILTKKSQLIIIVPFNKLDNNEVLKTNELLLLVK